MRFLILAVFLAVMQAAPPVPRKAADSARQTGDEIKKQADGNETPTAPPKPPVNSRKTMPDQNRGESPSAQNTEQPLRVRELPTVSISRDWADWVLWAASGLLAFAGLLGIGLAYKTLKAIERQGLSMRRQTTHLRRSVIQARKAATAAIASVEIVINKERARIRIEPEALSLHPSAMHVIDYKVFNYGYTRAFIQRAQVEITISNDRTPPRKPEWSWPMGLPPAIEPNNDGLANRAFFVPGMRLSPEQIEGIRQQKLFVHFWGAIQYKDVFENGRETRFAYVWIYSDLPNLPLPGDVPEKEHHAFWVKNGTQGEDYYET